MRIGEFYRSRKLALSFEVFPPKTAKGLDALHTTCQRLARHQPAFISGTYGAGGSTRDKTLEMLSGLRRELGVPVTAHFTCIGSTREHIRDWLRHATLLGVENIMALRGDPPVGQKEFVPTPGGLAHANELVSLIRREFPHFGIGVAGYPETHREAPSPQADLRYLKQKVDAGADGVFTQLFYDNQDFLRFRDRCRALKIEVPIVPGLLPVLSLPQVQRITELCAARLPDRLLMQLQTHAGDADAQIQVGVEHAAKQCEGLIREGVPGIHFYVLNRSDTLERILEYIL